MKKYLNISIALLGLAIAVPLVETGCTGPQQGVAVQTLKSVGETAEVAVAASAQLYHDHLIRADQAQAVIDLFDNKFKPPFNVAVDLAKSNLQTPATAELVALAGQIVSLVASYQHPTP